MSRLNDAIARQEEARRLRAAVVSAAPEGTGTLVDTELWDVEDLDLVESAHLTLGPDGFGELRLIAIGADIDYRISERDGMPFVEFSWAGYDESEPVSGRGWARREPGGALKGRLFIHRGDESGFTAYRDASDPGPKGRPGSKPSNVRLRRPRARR